MADVLPKIRVTDPQSSPERQDSPLTSGKIPTKLRPTSPNARDIEEAGQDDRGNGSSNGSEQAAESRIDPLSRHILKRTNTGNAVPRYRNPAVENTGQATGASLNDALTDTKKYSGEAARELNAASKADKKNRVSFLSRFIGTKKKGTLDGSGADNASEAGDSRPEGMDAQLFRHTVDNLGFNPKHLQPPAYIKVRTKFKVEKEFNRIFLAQELRSRTEEKTRVEKQSGAAASHNPIWATEFSKDGKYLAAGGQDRVLRVWAVISTPEERRSHEKDESGPGPSGGESTHLSAPVFQQKPFREYTGHQSTILDLSWSKNNFLLSSSMDKTVRLWHLSRNENLCTFKHNDFVPSIQFHPKDDRFFLAGSLDQKLRLWSIPDKSVAFWTQLSDMITSVAFTPDGKTCIAGTLGGLCMFYETEGLKYQSQIHVKSTRGQNAKGSKITGIQAIFWPPGSHKGDVKLLVTSNDSRVRIYNCRDKGLEMKFRAHENTCSQIRATFADDTGHIICGSEDRKTYIWSTTAIEGEKRNQGPVEMFEAHDSITTCAIMAPLKTRQLLSASEDPIFDLCNPPPVTLVSRQESLTGSKPPTEAGSTVPTPAESTFRKVAESPAYITRSAHTDGNIIVTTDYTGAIKVFRQDCAHAKRMKADNWDTSSVFSKRTGSKLGRSGSLISRTGRTRRDSTSTQPPDERIMTWRQQLSHGSFDSVNGSTPRRSIARSASPRKRGRASMTSIRPSDSPALGPTITTTSATYSGASGSPNKEPSIDCTSASLLGKPDTSSISTSTPPHERSNSQISSFDPVKQIDLHRAASNTNPLSVHNGQSWAFWNNNSWREQMASRGALAPTDDAGLRPELRGRPSVVSQLSSELPSEEGEVERCTKCGGTEFKVRVRGLGGKDERYLVCGKCGNTV